MKSKNLLIGAMVVGVLALGIVAAVKWHRGGGGGGDDADENVPTIIAVQVGTLGRVTLHRYVTGYATVEPAPATTHQPAAGGTLAAPTAGVVAKVNVIPGQRVAKGQVLVELNSATASFAYAHAAVERQKTLLAGQNTSLKNVEDAEALLASLEVIAPVAGTVTRIAVAPGQAVDVNAPVAEVIDLNRLALTTKVPAQEAAALKPGQQLEVMGEQPVTASLSYVSPTVDSSDGTVSAWAALSPDSGLRPGEMVPIRIVTDVRTNCLAAPATAVVTDEDGNSVVALVKGDQATQVPVQVGLHEDDWTEVSGTNLQAGDTVVTVGAYGLPDKTQIKIINSPAATPAATNSAAAQ